MRLPRPTADDREIQVEVITYGDLVFAKERLVVASPQAATHSSGGDAYLSLRFDVRGSTHVLATRHTITAPEAEADEDTRTLVAASTAVSVQLPRRRGFSSVLRGWERLKVVRQDKTPCRTLRAWLVSDDQGTQSIPRVLLYPTPDTANFMATIPDDTLWQDLSIAGTHDSCAVHGFPYAQCQQPATTVTQQLEDGIRFLDLRMRVVNDELIMYHGYLSQRALFTSVLDSIHTFLSAHPTESLLVSLKEEVPPIHPRFAELVWTAFAPHAEKFWFLESRLPTLGEVRGKAMIMPRFDIRPGPGLWDKGVGLKPERWPDDRPEGFEVACGPVGEESVGGARLRVQDWYGVSSILRIPEKLEAVKRQLVPIRDTVTTSNTLLSAAAGARPTDHGQSKDKAYKPPGAGATSEAHPAAASAPIAPIAQNTSSPLTISYLSAATVPFAPPALLAKGFGWPAYGLGVSGLNARMTSWLLGLMADSQRVRGVVPMDFYRQGGEVAELLVVMNYPAHGVLSKERADTSR